LYLPKRLTDVAEVTQANGLRFQALYDKRTRQFIDISADRSKTSACLRSRRNTSLIARIELVGQKKALLARTADLEASDGKRAKRPITTRINLHRGDCPCRVKAVIADMHLAPVRP
jgi:hypothetical protein